MQSIKLYLVSALFLSLFALPHLANAIPSSQPRITLQGNHCVRIATAGVDHGEDVAQKYADDLLAADLKDFKKKKGLKSLRIQRRFKKCKKHLWFFGQEYNCTSLAVACW
jgi:hypothetical protein